jgi:hypothetical protein
MALLAQQPRNGCCSRIFPHPHISSGASVAAHGNGKTESPSGSALIEGIDEKPSWTPGGRESHDTWV